MHKLIKGKYNNIDYWDTPVMKLLMVPIDFHSMEKNKWLPSTVGYQHFSKYLLLCFPIDCWRKINKHFKRSKKNLKECILCHINNIWPLHLKQMDFNFLCIFWYGVNLSLYLCVCVCVCVCVRACVRVCVCVCASSWHIQASLAYCQLATLGTSTHTDSLLSDKPSPSEWQLWYV